MLAGLNRQQFLDHFEEYKTAVEKDPTNVKARLLLAAAYKYKNMPKEVEAQYVEVLKLAPNYQNYNHVSIYYLDHGEYQKPWKPMVKL